MTVCILTSSAALLPASSNLNMCLRSLETHQGSQADYLRAYQVLERQFSAILVLAASEALLPGASNAQNAAYSHGGRVKISVLDTRQIGPGLGILAQTAAGLAGQGATLAELEQLVRANMPHLFTLICPEVGAAEAANSLPVCSIEDGQLSVYKTIRSRKRMLENLQEFMRDFEKARQLVYFYGAKSALRSRPLCETASQLFPQAQFSELEMNQTLNSLFGPQTVGLTVLEM